MAVYRTRAPRQGMTWTDWKIAIAMALPAALFLGVVLVVLVFG